MTFVPDNYDGLVLPLADSPHVAGLLVLDNADLKLRAKALAALARGAPRLGARLLRNSFWRRRERRRRFAYEARGKGFWVARSINDPAALRVLREGGFDLVINARTRFIYKDAALGVARLGCINIHHGLLPDQRGVMCDLWALASGQPAGFSIHRMTGKIDDGEILRVVTVSRGERDYGRHLAAAAAREADSLASLLDEIARTDRVAGTPNAHGECMVYRRDPTRADLRRMRARGMRL